MFDENKLCGFLLNGSLVAAISYLEQFPDKKDEWQQYHALFEKKHYRTYPVTDELNQILLIYQQYYRDVFFIGISKAEAIEVMVKEFQALFGTPEQCIDQIEAALIAAAFAKEGFHFLGGRTSGYYGPHVWTTTEKKQFDVELPDGTQPYTVKFLSDFVCKGWLDFISLGKIGTGGWIDNEGIINCIADSYDIASESFTVSLLKHEAQHVRDLAQNPAMPSSELEYRAKLVELIYSKERCLLPQFVEEADHSDTANGHAMAAYRLISEFEQYAKCTAHELSNLTIDQVQKIAGELYHRRDAEQKDEFKEKHKS